ncbi:glycosyl hydrolase [Coniochaeta sp. 2T2.1]|nr:glycosyl hydrolase [Coniochaeta sp. 2T2.1]
MISTSSFILSIVALLSLPVNAIIWNPIITGWNPDPAIVRHGDYYYIATSSFEYFPGVPIYRSKYLANWTLFSHAFNRPGQVALYGTATGAGTWAPSLAHFQGRFWLASMTRWAYDPVARVWPRVFFVSSPDMIQWSDPVWAEPWGIDPELFHDPTTGKTYLNLMAPNNNQDRLWGISQCEVSVSSGKCIGPYTSLWNGTLSHDAGARPEGPKMYLKDDWYYLLIAEGGTDELHRTTIARSRSPSGPFEANPRNPLIYNGQYGFTNLTVQSTGHAAMVETPDGAWYASLLARRNVGGHSPLGRETFLVAVTWEDGWPVFNGGEPVLLSEPVVGAAASTDGTQTSNSSSRAVPTPWTDEFGGSDLDPSWYQLRMPYTENFKVFNGRVVFRPNVFGLGDRDVPAAILRKQTSLNMTFSAELLGFKGQLGPRNRVGISAYLSEFQHQDIGLRGCVNARGICLYTELRRNGTVDYWQTPLNNSGQGLSRGLKLHVRATPLTYALGYSFDDDREPRYVAEIESRWQAFAPAGWFVFTGNSFALFATGDGEPWPRDAPEVGFSQVRETYYADEVGDYDRLVR